MPEKETLFYFMEYNTEGMSKSALRAISYHKRK